MGYRIENDCVGCDLPCIRCSRGRDYKQYYCDDCKEETDELYREGRKDLCWDCYKKQFISKVLDDCDDEKCNECGAEVDELYLCGNQWLCQECLMKQAERVETGD